MLRHMRQDEIDKMDMRMYEQWGQPKWSLPLFMEREAALNNTDYSRKSKQGWVLADGDTIHCCCEVYECDALVQRARVRAWGVFSVYTPVENRRKGYATDMLRQLAMAARAESATWAATGSSAPPVVALYLFSDIGARFYARCGFAPGEPDTAAAATDAATATATPTDSGATSSTSSDGEPRAVDVVVPARCDPPPPLLSLPPSSSSSSSSSSPSSAPSAPHARQQQQVQLRAQWIQLPIEGGAARGAAAHAGVAAATVRAASACSLPPAAAVTGGNGAVAAAAPPGAMWQLPSSDRLAWHVSWSPWIATAFRGVLPCADAVCLLPVADTDDTTGTATAAEQQHPIPMAVWAADAEENELNVLWLQAPTAVAGQAEAERDSDCDWDERWEAITAWLLHAAAYAAHTAGLAAAVVWASPQMRLQEWVQRQQQKQAQTTAAATASAAATAAAVEAQGTAPSIRLRDGQLPMVCSLSEEFPISSWQFCQRGLWG